MGEDLDLSWRCQVAGSRVVVAPDARVRHREAVAGGLEPLAVAIEPDGKRPRHHAGAATAPRAARRAQVLHAAPPGAGAAPGRSAGARRGGGRRCWPATATGPGRSSGAWRWNARHLTELSLLRGELAEHRLFPDSEVRRLQLRGSARLSRYLSRLSHQGLEAANAVTVGPGCDPSERRARRGGRPDRQRGLGLQRGLRLRRARRPRAARRAATASAGGSRRPRSAPGASASLAMVVALVVIAVGTRELFFGSLPLVGQLAPLPSWSTTWHHFFSGWQSAGVGTTAPASPAFGVVGIAGHRALRRHGHAAARPAARAASPSGAFGVSRFMRPLVSPRARVVAVICYLGLPLPYGALGTGPLGRPGRLRRSFPSSRCAWPGRRRWSPTPSRRRRTGGPAGRAGGDAGRHHRRRQRRSRPAVVPLVLLAALAWARRLGARRRTRCAVGGPSLVAARGGGRRARARAALGGRHRAGRQGLGRHLRPAARRQRPPRTGASSSASPSGRPPGRRWSGSWSPQPRCRCSLGAGSGSSGRRGCGSPPARRGGWPWPPSAATWARSPPPCRSCWPRRRSPSPPASVSGSPRSRTT